MKYHYAVIEREYGSGGTEIGRRVSVLGGIPSYGSEILERVSENLHIDVGRIQQYEEKATNSFLYSIYLMGRIDDGSRDSLSREEQIYLEEQKVIRELSEMGPCVFVGRCAVNAFEDRKDVLKVFIRADRGLRVKRAVESYGIETSEADGVVHRFDRKRSSYYSANTGKNWHDAENYHLVLDSGKLGLESCAGLIWKAMQE